MTVIDTDLPQPKFGEIYWIHPGQTTGQELRGPHRFVILRREFYRYSVWLCAPLVKWDVYRELSPFFHKIEPTSENGLNEGEPRTIDVFQARAVDVSRISGIPSAHSVTPAQLEAAAKALFFISGGRFPS